MNSPQHPAMCEHGSCLAASRLTVVKVSNRQHLETLQLCELHFQAFREPLAQEENRLRVPYQDEIEVDLESVVVDEWGSTGYFRLGVLNGRGALVSMGGPCEMTALRYRITGFVAPRPLTYDALASTIDALDGRLEDVIIDALVETEGVEGGVYHAKLRLQHRGRRRIVDVRPSDAVNLAVVCNVPILVKRSVLEAVARRKSP